MTTLQFIGAWILLMVAFWAWWRICDRFVVWVWDRWTR